MSEPFDFRRVGVSGVCCTTTRNAAGEIDLEPLCSKCRANAKKWGVKTRRPATMRHSAAACTCSGCSGKKASTATEPGTAKALAAGQTPDSYGLGKLPPAPRNPPLVAAGPPLAAADLCEPPNTYRLTRGA
jgi:hypothetical protein